MSAVRLTDLLALSHIPRWTIVTHVVPQSVGDHTFRVMVIYAELCTRLNRSISIGGLLYVLQHDAPESRTGDVPTPAKRILPLEEWGEFIPWTPYVGPLDNEDIATFQLADLIEAHTFIEMYGKGEHSRRVAADIYAKIRNMTPAEDWPVVARMIDEIVFEAGR